MKKLAIGIASLVVLVGIVVFIFGPGRMAIEAARFKEFDQAVWASGPIGKQRYYMKKDLEKVLIGLTQEEVHTLLGSPSCSGFRGGDEWALEPVHYVDPNPPKYDPHAENGRQTLLVVFESGKVARTTVQWANMTCINF